MSIRAWLTAALLSVTSLVAVGSLLTAQARQTVPLPSPVVVSGADLGFRIEGKQGDVPVGKLVVRINGQWVEVAGSAGTRAVPLTR